MTCLGVLERGERSDDNGTSLKEGGLVEMSTTVLPFAMLALFALNTYRSSCFYFCFVTVLYSSRRIHTQFKKQSVVEIPIAFGDRGVFAVPTNNPYFISMVGKHDVSYSS